VYVWVGVGEPKLPNLYFAIQARVRAFCGGVAAAAAAMRVRTYIVAPLQKRTRSASRYSLLPLVGRLAVGGDAVAGRRGRRGAQPVAAARCACVCACVRPESWLRFEPNNSTRRPWAPARAVAAATHLHDGVRVSRQRRRPAAGPGPLVC
jgi:hypothetical protein